MASANDDGTQLLVELTHQSGGGGRKSTKNVDRSLYFSSEAAKTCPLCRKRYSRHMVTHFKTNHPNDEVFISRISPKMVEFIAPQREQERHFVRYNKYHSEHLETKCIFCEENKSFSAHYWIDHMRSHTGEYGYLCSVCEKMCCFPNHCNAGATRTLNFDLRNDDMMAYRCNKCNFIQIDQQNIRMHLERQHVLYGASEEHFQTFKLLPAFRCVAKRNHPNDEQGKLTI